MFKCPGSYTQWSTVTVTGGTIVSVGYQNMGLRPDLYTTQLFAYDPNHAFVQVNNTSSNTVEWRIWVVVASSSAEEVPELGEVEHDMSEIESANG